MTRSTPARRIALKQVAFAGTAVAFGGFAATAQANKNAAIRTALKYQDEPKAGAQCDGCLQWVPGKAPTDAGGCKVIPGDNEISPKGWCAAFVVAPKK